MNLKYVLDAATHSDTGRVHSRNEDLVGEDLALGAVALADGMGGHHGGDVASTLAVDTILRISGPLYPALHQARSMRRQNIQSRVSPFGRRFFTPTKRFMRRLNRNLNTETWAQL
ncbi:MAG: hypothetical protein M3120_07800 [Pseudomonadota bacterium]|nr:hypothetical protein [Pseudomonadota bacterium]